MRKHIVTLPSVKAFLSEWSLSFKNTDYLKVFKTMICYLNVWIYLLIIFKSTKKYIHVAFYAIIQWHILLPVIFGDVYPL